MSQQDRFRWAEVEPLGIVNGALKHALEKVDNLREAWGLSLAQASSGEFTEARRRRLRRHAIETGIIERLYDVDWGVTEALVAEGLTAEVAASAQRPRADSSGSAASRHREDTAEPCAAPGRHAP